jgi:hypothetical protein
MEALLGEYEAGNTGDRRMAALGVAHGQDLATVRDNASRRQQELSFAESAAIGGTRVKLASLRAPERPSSSGLALGLAGSALQFGSRMNQIDNPHPGAGTRSGSSAIEPWRRNGSGGD